MSAAGKAVFLSYASQDAEAARRVCEALRAAGVEVWFDQSELSAFAELRRDKRGGDTRAPRAVLSSGFGVSSWTNPQSARRRQALAGRQSAMSSAASKAVFLSYAFQDADAARKICDALRGAAVEVWFDQSELRGGDAWDAKIRKQIKECALFVPIVSANTQARTEGYFRLEWRLADQRTHLMARGKSFLLPVAVDDTRDSDAHVPDSFLEVQWTRLPFGEAPVELAARVAALLDGNANPAPALAGARPAFGEAANPRGTSVAVLAFANLGNALTPSRRTSPRASCRRRLCSPCRSS